MKGANLPTYSVGEISTLLKRTIEKSFFLIRVEGEVMEVKKHSNGHLYFNLAEDRAQLRAVVWKSQVYKLQHYPKEGDMIRATGKLTTWHGQSSYQLNVEDVDLAGEGALLLKVEKLKQKLRPLFERAKRPLPTTIRRIGLVTSKDGAVFKDITKTIGLRMPIAITFCSASVQGEGAVNSLLAAINALYQENLDLIVIARGGGSISDLMPFNDERLIRFVAKSPLPIVSAIGHEPDHTLLDLIADQRAATPTAAATLVTPITLERYRQHLNALRQRARHSCFSLYALQQETAQEQWRRCRQSSVFALENLHGRLKKPPSLKAQLDVRLERQQHLRHRLQQTGQNTNRRLAVTSEKINASFRSARTAWRNRFHAWSKEIQSLSDLLRTLDPEAVLERGYAIIRDQDSDAVVAKPEQVPEHKKVVIQFAKGQRLPATITTPTRD